MVRILPLRLELFCNVSQKVLFASPLVRTTSGDVLAVPRLDVEAEVKSLSRLVLEAKCPVGLEPCVATVENLRPPLPLSP